MTDTNIDSEVRRRLLDVAEDLSGLDDFVDWFVGATWDVQTELIADVNLLLAERKLLDQADLREAMLALVRTVHIGDNAGIHYSSSGAVVALTRLDLTDPPVTVTQHVHLA